MKKVLYGMTMVMSLMWVTNVQAQENGSGLTRAEKKSLGGKVGQSAIRGISPSNQ